MITEILTAKAMYRVRSLDQMRQRHADILAKNRARGFPVEAHTDARPIVARVNHGRWLVDCVACGSGAGVDPDWPEARCFGCGAIYTSVVLPPDRVAIETVLVKRPRLDTRNWEPGETADTLRAENVERGVR